MADATAHVLEHRISMQTTRQVDAMKTYSPIRPLYIARSRSGTRSDMMMLVIDKIPPPPAPCTAKGVAIQSSTRRTLVQEQKLRTTRGYEPIHALCRPAERTAEGEKRKENEHGGPTAEDLQNGQLSRARKGGSTYVGHSAGHRKE